MKLKHTEADHQRALADWLDAIGVLWFHPPNGGFRHARVAAKLKAEGVKAGVPDVWICTPPPNVPDAPGCVVELKAKKGGRLSKHQRRWLDDLAVLGWLVFVSHGHVPAIEWLKGLGYGGRRG